MFRRVTPTMGDFYVCLKTGDDNADGLSLETAFKSLSKADSVMTPAQKVIVGETCADFVYLEKI